MIPGGEKKKKKKTYDDNVLVGAVEKDLEQSHEEQLLGPDLADPDAERDEDGSRAKQSLNNLREPQLNVLRNVA